MLSLAEVAECSPHTLPRCTVTYSKSVFSLQCPSGHSPPSSLEGTPLYSVTNTVLSVLLPTEHLSNPLFAFVSPFILEKNNDPKLKKPQSQTHRQKQPELQEQLTALEDGHVEPASPAREFSGSQRADTNCEDTNSSQHRVLLRHSMGLTVPVAEEGCSQMPD